MNIGGIEIGGENPCRFVAEISNAHNGSLIQAFKLIDAAKEAGADFVKFQCYTPDELVALRGDGPAPEPWGSQGWTMKTLYEKAKTPLEWFPLLFQHARDIGIVPFSSVFGLESLLTLERVACPAYKIARMESENSGLYLAVESRGKPVIISTDDHRMGGGYRGGNVWYLYCAKGYPTPHNEFRLPKRFPVNDSGLIGISSHCLDRALPIAAVARGYKLIEMHFQLDAERSELEAEVSLTATEFRDMIETVRRTEEMLS